MKLSPVTLGSMLILGLFAGPLTVDAQQAEKVYRIGMLETRSAALNAANVEAFAKDCAGLDTATAGTSNLSTDRPTAAMTGSRGWRGNS